MDERHQSLTPRERQEFEEIRVRLSGEMPEVEPEVVQRKRRSTSIAVGLAGVGVMLLVVGLLAETVVVAFAGFVGILFAGWRLSLLADPERWRTAVGGWLRPDGPQQRGPR